MRTLAFKLTLAFLIVGITGAVLVSLFVSLRTEREFDRFVLDRFQADLVENLATYYRNNGSWEGIGAIVVRNPYNRGGMQFMHAPVTLTDAAGVVIYGGRRYYTGQQLDKGEMAAALPVKVDNAIVGHLLFSTFEGATQLRESPESAFLARVRQAIWLGAVAAIGVALLLGAGLARGITRPLRALTAATQRVAQGELGLQVEPGADDELGELTRSFNQMSHDLAEASRLRRQMTADIAHDLRTPLTVILGYTEALAEGKMSGQPAIYDAMHEEAQHLQHLIEDLRTLSLADAGELRLQRQPCSPRRLLERILAAHRLQAEQQGVRLHLIAAEDLPDIDIDPDRMTQVLNNLVSNALRHTPAGGEIALAAEGGPANVRLTVRDTGAGIPAADLPHIFERHFRGDKARGQDASASGLGLAIVKSLVDLHGGEIGVSSASDQGATFTITLPSHTPAAP
ncbi:MAG: HAMP domain-containing histidine kinase [Caldilineales bacterium]|nr:HAMP domain-containing histidine kinase [Caldilineales bacterium]